MPMDEKTTIHIDFPKLDPPDNWRLGVVESWQLADGSILWKVEGQLIGELTPDH